MEEHEIRPLTKLIDRLCQSPDMRLLNMPNLCIPQMQEHMPDGNAQLMTGVLQLVAQIYGSAHQSIKAFLFVHRPDHVPNIQARKGNEPVPLEPNVAMQSEKEEIWPCPIRDRKARLLSFFLIESPNT